MAESTRRSWRLRARLDSFLELALVVLFSGLVLAVTWQVVSRYVLRQPSQVTEELARYLLIWLGLFGAAFAYGKRLHVGIDALTARLDPALRRATEVLSAVVACAFALSVLVFGGTRLALLTLELDQRTAALGIQLGWIYWSLPVAGLAVVLYSVEELAHREQDQGDG